MNAAMELNKGRAVLFLMPSENYNDLIIKMARDFSKKKVCYVTLNKTYDSLKELFKKHRVKTDNIIFIDAISKTFKEVKKEKNCMFCNSPGAMMELSIAISKTLKKYKCEYLVFDSLTNLLIYQRKAPVAEFISKVVNTSKDQGVKIAIYALKMKQHEELVEETSMFVDKVVNAI